MNNMKNEFFNVLDQDEVLEVNGGGVVVAVAAITFKKAVTELVKWGVVTAVTGFAGGAVYEWILGE